MTGAWSLALFPLAALATVLSGAPVFLVLVAVALAGALGGAAAGVFDLGLLAALPARLVGLLEHDLLQALALYALVGALLHRLHLGALWLRCAAAALRRLGLAGGPAQALATLGLALLTAPMNGSVGASLGFVRRVALPPLRAAGVAPGRAAALLALAGTLGVIVPPSLVLLLLGDALMRAHTEALQHSAAAVQVVHNQAVLQAVLLPGAVLLLLWAGCAVALGRNGPAVLSRDSPAALGRYGPPALSRDDPVVVQPGPAAPEPPPTGRDLALATLLTLAVPALLAAVAAGRLYAVEAAAAAGLALLGWGAVSGALRGQWAALLDEAMRLTGMVFGLLVGATVFTLVLRGYGADAWLAGTLAALPGGAPVALAVVMALLLVAGSVLDAFEVIFLVVPLVMPPLLALMPTAAPQVAVLALLVLQAGYLLPPLGYALLLARGGDTPVPAGAVVRALAPALAALALVVGGCAWWALSVPAASEVTPAGGVDVDAVLRAAPSR